MNTTIPVYIKQLSLKKNLLRITNYLASLPCNSFSLSCSALFKSIICCVFYRENKTFL